MTSTTNPKILAHLRSLADTAVSESVRGLANAAATQNPEAGVQSALISSAHEFSACALAYLESIGAR
jgi:hypothetical protein